MYNEIDSVKEYIIRANCGQRETANILNALNSLWRIALQQAEDIASLKKQVEALQAAVPSGALKDSE